MVQKIRNTRNVEDENANVKPETSKETKRVRKMDRRKLIATMGVTGAAVVSGGLVNSFDNIAHAAGKGNGSGKKNGPITDDADRISYSYADDQPERTVGEKLREMISVKDFGAKGDGKTNDTTAIQTAINHAVESGKREVYFPGGTYKVEGNQGEYISSTKMKEDVDKLKDKKEIKSDEAVHALNMQLTAIDHFEQQKKADKVVNSTKNLKQLLDHQRDQKMLSKKAYKKLKSQTESLQQKWETYDKDKDKDPLHIEGSIIFVGDDVKFIAGDYKAVSVAELYDQIGELAEENENVKKQLKERAREVTPISFGAVGDGKTDDYLALQNCFKEAMDNGYTVNLLSRMVYLVGSRDESWKRAMLIYLR